MKQIKVSVNFEKIPSISNLSFSFSISELQDIAGPFFFATEEIINKVLAESKWGTKSVSDLVLLCGRKI